MSGGSLLFASYTILVLPFTVISQTPNTETCTLSCGNINISYPFRLNGDPQNCGNERFELSCEANSTTAVLYLSSGKYYVKSINYNNFTIRVVNAGVLKNNNYYPDPIYSLTTDNFTRENSYYGISSQYISMEPVPVIFVTCTSPMNSTLSIETAPCLSYSSKYSYFMVGSINSFDLGRSGRHLQRIRAKTYPVPQRVWRVRCVTLIWIFSFSSSSRIEGQTDEKRFHDEFSTSDSFTMDNNTVDRIHNLPQTPGFSP